VQLTDLLQALRRYWPASLAVFLLVMSLGVVSAYSPAEEYRSSATVDVGVDIAANAAGLAGLENHMGSLERLVTGDIVLVTGLTLKDVSDEPVFISAHGTPNGLLTITAESTDKDAVAPWATTIANEIVERKPQDKVFTYRSNGAAPAPSEPFAPDRPPVIVGSFVLALIAAVLTALGIETWRRRRDGAEEIRRRFGTSVLAEIPFVRPRTSARPGVIVGGAAPPEVVEAFQALRTNIQVALLELGDTSIAITSAGPGEGKSLIASTLAMALASAGHRVALVDADLRRPNVHRVLDLPLEPGLASADRTDHHLLARKVGEHLVVTTAGVAHRHPAEVIGSNLPPLLESIGVGRTTIVDCPPIEGLAETSAITTTVDWVVVVIDARRRDYVDIERTLAELRARNAQILGVVVNRARTHRRKRTHEYYWYNAEPPREQRSAAVAPLRKPGEVPARRTRQRT
jgi:polysaccharide biosynthesis transport protein